MFFVSGGLGGIRIPDLCLRRALLYPAELQTHMERVKGIGPSQPAWKAGTLPLSYTRINTSNILSYVKFLVNKIAKNIYLYFYVC